MPHDDRAVAFRALFRGGFWEEKISKNLHFVLIFKAHTLADDIFAFWEKSPLAGVDLRGVFA